MYQTVRKNPIHLVHKDGGIEYTFKSYESLVYNWPLIRHLDIGIQHTIKYTNYEYNLEVRRLNRRPYPTTFPEHQHEFILRDSIGDTYSPAQIKVEHIKKFGYGRRGRGWSEGRHPAYGSFRLIRTFQERKWAHAWDDEEFCPPPRAARQGHNLPDPWDDYWGHNEKCWKRHSKRRHQWKPNG